MNIIDTAMQQELESRFKGTKMTRFVFQILSHWNSVIEDQATGTQAQLPPLEGLTKTTKLKT